MVLFALFVSITFALLMRDDPREQRRFGARLFSTTGLLLVAASFVGLLLLPTDFDYTAFAVLLLCSGLGQGMFSAPNTSSIMGSDATSCAVPAGTPLDCRPSRSTDGSDEASPETISAKNTPMDSAVPEFWNVDRMPEATPRCSAGTLPMIDDVLGAENIP